MSTIACPKCKRPVIAMEVFELADLVTFDVDESFVLVEGGTKVTKGCTPHRCEGLPAIVDRTKYIPIEEVKVTCQYCEEVTLAIDAVFTTDDGWKCSLCIKDHAEQEAERKREIRPPGF